MTVAEFDDPFAAPTAVSTVDPPTVVTATIYDVPSGMTPFECRSWAAPAVLRSFSVCGGGGSLLDPDTGKPLNKKVEKLARLQHWRGCASCGDAVETFEEDGTGRCPSCGVTFRWSDSPPLVPLRTLAELKQEVSSPRSAARSSAALATRLLRDSIPPYLLYAFCTPRSPPHLYPSCIYSPALSTSPPQFEWQALEVAYQNKFGNDELYWDTLITRPSAANGIQALEK